MPHFTATARPSMHPSVIRCDAPIKGDVARINLTQPTFPQTLGPIGETDDSTVGKELPAK